MIETSPPGRFPGAARVGRPGRYHVPELLPNHRQDANRACRHYLGQRTNALQYIIHDLRVKDALARGQQKHSESENSFGLKTRFDMIQSEEAADHESGAGDQDQSQRNLSYDQNATQPMAGGDRSARLVKITREVQTSGLQGRHQTKQDTGRKGN